jgi:uncharacterized FAD-dependent dehydrogenase
MKYDVIIVGAGPAGIFTAYEMLEKGSKKKIIMLEKGSAIENRSCPKGKVGKCVNCKPYCHITTGFSGAASTFSSTLGAISSWLEPPKAFFNLSNIILPQFLLK